MDYAIEFQSLATDSAWNNAALVNAFIGGLSQQIRRQIITLELPEGLDEVISVINKIYRCLADHLWEHSPNLHSHPRFHRFPVDASLQPEHRQP